MRWVIFAILAFLNSPSTAAVFVNGDFSDGLTGWSAVGWSVGGPGTGVSAADLGLSLPPVTDSFAYTSCSDSCVLSQTFTEPKGIYEASYAYSYSGPTRFQFVGFGGG